uniref:C2H2-type domain-containing protein n=1 Tax=Meloidogyne hapla TaxID=6305 RepID=A0A1I8BC57_MELHA
MQNQNKSNSIQNSTISSIFPRLQSPPLLLPHSHLSHFPNPYQSIFFRPFVIQRPLVPPMNLFLSPLPFIRIRPITIPEREKKLISKLSIESIIGSTEVENRKNTSENKASFEPTSEENAQIKASEACSSGAVEPNHGYACHRCGKLFSYAYYRDKHLKFTPCVDNGQRRFPCPHCLRYLIKYIFLHIFLFGSFEKRDRLRIHILHVHERRRPHVCQICKKAFSQSSSLSKAN